MAKLLSARSSVKKTGFVWFAMVLLAALAMSTALDGSASDIKAQNHSVGATVVVTPFEVGLDSEAVVSIYGSNLPPGAELSIFVIDPRGTWMDITGLTSYWPTIVNDDGAFGTQWTLARYARSGVLDENVLTVRIVDQDMNTLATTPIAFCDYERDDDAPVPTFCSR